MIRTFLNRLRFLTRPIEGNESFFIVFPSLLLPHTCLGFIRDALRSGFSTEFLADIGSISIPFLYSYISCVILFITKLKTLKFVLYSISISIFFINIYLRISFGTLVSANILLLIGETSPQEIQDFIESFLLSRNTLTTIMILFVVIGIIICIERYQERITMLIPIKSHALLLNTFIIVIGCGSIHLPIYLLPIRSASTNILADYFRLANIGRPDYLTSFFHSVLYLKIASQELSIAVETNKSLNNVTLSADVTSPFVIGLVIGESSSKWHSNLYGYDLKTEPKLTKECQSGNLIVFDNVISNYCHTSESLRTAMSCGEIGGIKQWFEKPYFPTLFAKAGYSVYFWDNQYNPASPANWDFTLNSYLHNQSITQITYKKCNSNIFKYDGDLIEDFKRQTDLKFDTLSMIMFHLNGQHFNVDNRYPHNKIDVFNEMDIKRDDKYLTIDMKRHIASYDNSIYYTDSLVSKIINYFRDKNAVLVYFSDHGEINYDFSEQIGRKVPIKQYTQEVVKYLYGIPFYIWCSDIFKELNIDTYFALCRNRHKPMTLDDLNQLLLHLGGVQSEIVDSSRNVLSDSYRIKPRLIEGHLNYDDFFQE